MEEIQLPQKVEIIKSQGNRATLVIEPCFPGYGLTLGNALRRVLLSSLPGGAVTAVKIKGVDHEFSALPFVKEDMVDIILNLKQLRFKVYKREPVKITLNVKGEKEVKARDIKTGSDVEIANPDLRIATLTDKKAELEMEITVSQGRGYKPVEQREEEKREIGEIAVDAIFTPIKNVSYKIENIRVGEMTNFDKLNIDLETDGTVSPKDALEEAAKILVNHFSCLAGLKLAKVKEMIKKTPRRNVGDKREKAVLASAAILEDLSLEELRLSKRTLNALKKKRVTKVKDLAKMTEEKLGKIPGIGDSARKEIKRILGRKGILLQQKK
ncbi:MAG: DNA-directed RNA polymerase subunit alpha [Patescibacteria group bacterium]|nr:DNA-directed RNA polymerase subunit alpha [Patescibacteria group bacterium]